MPFAVAAYITAAYWFTASTSFANPAVTLARAASDTFAGIRPADVPGFIVAQLARRRRGHRRSSLAGPRTPAGGVARRSTTARARIERIRSRPSLRLGHRGDALRDGDDHLGHHLLRLPRISRRHGEDLGASRVVVTGAFSLGLGVAALAGVPVGRWLDRRGARLLMTVGSVSPPRSPCCGPGGDAGGL